MYAGKGINRFILKPCFSRRPGSSSSHTKHDLIGPPDSLSNVSPLRFRGSEDVDVSDLLTVYNIVVS